MSEVRGRRMFLTMLRMVAALGVTFSFAAPPLAVLAAPNYTVASNLDASKLFGSGAACQSTAPGNPCTLRAAIETANAGGPGAVIDVPGALGTIALNPSLGTLSVNTGMTVEATGTVSPRIDGAGATSILSSTSTAPVTLTGLTLQNSMNGGLVNGGAAMTLNAVTVTGNHGNPGVFSAGQLTMNGSTVTGNFDGGMVLVGPTTLNNSNVTQNLDLGGIFASDAPLTLNGGSVSDNIQASGDGGGVVSFNTLTANGTTFARNSAVGAGGGVAVVGPATLTGVKITDNTSGTGGAGVIIDGTGGPADATITNSTLSGNSTSGDGGGIQVLAATLTLTGSTLNGNRSTQGAGGGIQAETSTVSLTNDTLTGNTAPTLSGGGIAQEVLAPASPRGRTHPQNALAVAQRELQSVRTALASHHLSVRLVPEAVKPMPAAPKAKPDDVTLESVTLAGNSAGRGGGVANALGLLFRAHDTILANNTSTTAEPDCMGPVTSSGYNLESAADCGFTAAGDKQGSNPQLAPLASNGGPTNTMALPPGSPAINAGDPACPAPPTDQRGVSRPQGGRCDIGAFEAVPVVTVSLPAPPVTGHPQESQPAWVRLTALAGILALMVLISASAAVRS